MDTPDTATPTERVRSVITRLFDAVERRDTEAYFDRTYHPKVTIHEADSLPYGGTYRGFDGARRHAEGFLRTWAPLQNGATARLQHTVHALPDQAFVTWPLTTVAPTAGPRRPLPVVSHYRMRDGLIIESQMYHFDTVAVLNRSAGSGT